LLTGLPNSTFSYGESTFSPDLSVWDTPVLNWKRKIQGGQSFIDEQPNFKLDAQNLIVVGEQQYSDPDPGGSGYFDKV